MPRITVRTMIEEDLGYCCPYFFFSYFKRTQVICERLGVARSTIKVHKANVREGLETCPGRANCMKALIGVRR